MRPLIHRVTLFLFAVVAGLSAAHSAHAATRGLTVELRESEASGVPVTEAVQLYGSSHALVIGIDDYTNGWPRLSKAVEDARAIAAALAAKGFSVTLKTNLNSDDLEDALKEFFVLKGADPESRLFLWYAGHGHTINGEGYLIPADAPRPEHAAQFRLKALSLRRIGESVRLAQSKHAFAVFDSCFSGTVFESARALPPAAVTRATTLPVRQFLTSGDAGQTVSDDGTFRELFVRALSGDERADANGDGYVTGSEMGLFLTDRVTNLTQSRQTPRYGKLRDIDWDQGDFVFKVASVGQSRAEAPPVPRGIGGRHAELLFWETVKDSKDAADYADYLTQYPKGAFASLAKRRLKRLKDKQTASLTPPTVTVEATVSTYIALKTANVRRQPSALSAKIGTVALGTTVTVTGKVDGGKWLRIKRPGNKAAYVFGKLLALESAESLAWYRIKNSRSVADIDNFLQLYPNGFFAARAKKLKATLSTKKTYRWPPKSSAPSQTTPPVGIHPEDQKPGVAFKDCKECPEMVVIPSSTFWMGDHNNSGKRNETPLHEVSIGYNFAVGKYEVTYGEYAVFSNATRRHDGDGCNYSTTSEVKKDVSKNWRNPPIYGQTDRGPVTCVNLDDAHAYVEWLNRITGQRYRLLSEAEWEYAARSGTQTEYSFGRTVLLTMANYGSAAGGPKPVGSFKPNSFGLYDMHGNVSEWVEDCLYDGYRGAPRDGSPWKTGVSCKDNTVRGGGWISSSRNIRSASRFYADRRTRNYSIGFRVARMLSLSKPKPSGNASDSTKNLQKGIEALRQKNYAAAVQILEPLAHSGNGGAQYLLGLVLGEGVKGVPKNSEVAVEWLLLAARKGQANAQYLLSQHYTRGEGVPSDIIEAMKWIHISAKNGHKHAIEMQKTMKVVAGKDQNKRAIDRADIWRTLHKQK